MMISVTTVMSRVILAKAVKNPITYFYHVSWFFQKPEKLNLSLYYYEEKYNFWNFAHQNLGSMRTEGNRTGPIRFYHIACHLAELLLLILSYFILIDFHVFMPKFSLL